MSGQKNNLATCKINDSEILITGMKTMDYGDSFVYNLKNNTYRPYEYILDQRSTSYARGAVCNGYFYVLGSHNNRENVLKRVKISYAPTPELGWYKDSDNN